MAQRCTRYKRVRSKFGGTVRRCASYSGRSSNGRRRKYKKRRRSGMARKGSHCVRYKRVRIKGGGTVRRCAKYSGGRGRRRYRKGKAPFNKGKKCVAWGTAIRKGKVVQVCKSYGSTSGWRSKRGRRAGGRTGTYQIPGTGITVKPSTRPSLYASGPSSVGAAYRASQQAARRYGEGQRRTLAQRILGTG
jgi:hypothetical protein